MTGSNRPETAERYLYHPDAYDAAGSERAIHDHILKHHEPTWARAYYDGRVSIMIIRDVLAPLEEIRLYRDQLRMKVARLQCDITTLTAQLGEPEHTALNPEKDSTK